DLTPISSWISTENTTIMVLMILISFFTLIYLMNLFIGIISNLIRDKDIRNISYLILIAEILNEVELFYMLPHQRRKENWFPNTIFYGCHTYKLREHIIDIQNKGIKPYLSKNLKIVLQLPEEQPDIKQMEDIIIKQAKDIEDLKTTIDDIKSSQDKAFKDIEKSIINIVNKLE
ncbi:10559_t:CDS:2, partial [Scutellospora calospora]